MKTNAIFRIILYSLALLILLGILVGGLGAHLYMFRSSRENTGEVSRIPDKIDSESVYADADFSADSASIHRVEIDWVSGSITMEGSSNADSITVRESRTEAPDMRMICRVRENTLHIEYCKEAIRFPGSGSASKDLVIQVPQGWLCGELEIETASADVKLQDVTVREVDFDGASGSFHAENCNITDMDIDVASGDVIFRGTLETLDFDGASSDCSLTLTNCPRKLELGAMSGNLDLTLPPDCGFTVELEGISSKFVSDFTTTQHNSRHVHGDGSCRIHVEAMSGTVSINKGEDSNHHQRHE